MPVPLQTNHCMAMTCRFMFAASEASRYNLHTPRGKMIQARSSIVFETCRVRVLVLRTPYAVRSTLRETGEEFARQIAHGQNNFPVSVTLALVSGCLTGQNRAKTGCWHIFMSSLS